MKPRLVLYAFLSCLLLGLAQSGGARAQAQDSLTESQIMAIVNAADKAAKNKDINGVTANMAKDIQIKFIVDGPSPQEMSLNLEKYIFHTKRAFSKRVAYTYDRRNTRVAISKDGQTATVNSTVYESYTTAQGTLRGVTSEVAVIKLRQGKPVVTYLAGRTRFY